MKRCIATVSVPGTFSEKITAIAHSGFDAIELFEPDLNSYSQMPRQAAAFVRDCGLEIALLQPLRNFEGKTGTARSKALEEAKQKFDLMDKLGTKLLLACSSVLPESSPDIGHIVEDFWKLADAAKARNIRIGFEALAWARHIKDLNQAWDVVRTCAHPNFGLVIDSFHLLLRKNDPTAIRSIPGDKIFFFQIADAPHMEVDVMTLSRQFRVPPGLGDLDVMTVAREVLATGYAGPLSLEIFWNPANKFTPGEAAEQHFAALTNFMTKLGL